MKKVKVLLSATAVVAVVAVAIASKARENNAIYLPNPVTTSICDVKQPGKAILTTTNVGGVFATSLKGSPCVRVLTQDVIN